MMMLVEVANGRGLGEQELVYGNEVGDRTDNVEIVEWRRMSMFRQCWCDGDGGEEKPHLPLPPLDSAALDLNFLFCKMGTAIVGWLKKFQMPAVEQVFNEISFYLSLNFILETLASPWILV